MISRSNGIHESVYQPAFWEKVTASVFAGIIVLVVVLVTLRNEPFRDPNIVVLLRMLVSLSVAALGATIPGFLQIGIKRKAVLIRAGGALSLFVLTYWFTPQILGSNTVNTNNGTQLVGLLNERAKGILRAIDDDILRLESNIRNSNQEHANEISEQVNQLKASRRLFEKLQKQHVAAIENHEFGRVVELTRQLSYLQLTSMELRAVIENSGSGGYGVGMVAIIPNRYPGIPPSAGIPEQVWPAEVRQEYIHLSVFDDTRIEILDRIKSEAKNAHTPIER